MIITIFFFSCPTDHSSPVQMALLLHEGLTLVGMAHKHVYTVIGVAAEERVPPFLIYPDDGFRNLKRQVQHYYMLLAIIINMMMKITHREVTLIIMHYSNSKGSNRHR